MKVNRYLSRHSYNIRRGIFNFYFENEQNSKSSPLFIDIVHKTQIPLELGGPARAHIHNLEYPWTWGPVGLKRPQASESCPWLCLARQSWLMINYITLHYNSNNIHHINLSWNFIFVLLKNYLHYCTKIISILATVVVGTCNNFNFHATIRES